MKSRFTRHFETQARLGVKPLRASLELPRHGLNYLQRQRMVGDQVHGYGLYDRPLLAAYSRSGTNWIRYVVEWISGCPTPGQVRLHSGHDFVIDRAHCADRNMASYATVLLVIRDYREALLRHLDHHWEANPNVRDFLTAPSPTQPADWYIRNIEAFDEHPGRKQVIYYEDLVADPPQTIHQITAFLGLDADRTNTFIEDIDVHRRVSLHSYTEKGHRSATRGANDFRHHAEALLSTEQVSEFDDYYRTRHPTAFERYLTRYAIG